MVKEAIPWMCHVPAALYGRRNQLWAGKSRFQKISRSSF